MQIFVKTLSGRSFATEVEPEHTVRSIQSRIREVEGIPEERQRIIFAGNQLREHATLAASGIKAESTIHLCLRLRGMISTFSAGDAEDPSIKYLMMTEKERAATEVPTKRLDELADQNNTSKNGYYTFASNALKLFPELEKFPLDTTEAFADFLWIRYAKPGQKDLRVNIPWAVMNQLHETTDAESVFERSFISEPECKLAIRVTKGPTDGCIGFHVDGTYATSTTQFALNDDFEGGQLCFFSMHKLHMVPRIRGSMTQHVRNVLHAVTRLVSGTRKSLFVLDETNGLGEEGVITANIDDAKVFREEVEHRHHATASRKRKLDDSS